MEASQNPFAHLKQTLQIGEKSYQYYNLQDLKDERLPTLPYSIRVLLEAAVRNCDNFHWSSEVIHLAYVCNSWQPVFEYIVHRTSTQNCSLFADSYNHTWKTNYTVSRQNIRHMYTEIQNISGCVGTRTFR